MSIKKRLKSIPPVLLLWNEQRRIRGSWTLKRFTDEQAIRRAYASMLGSEPNLDEPKRFSEKMQWLKLYYRDSNIPICSDKYEVRQYLTNRGYAHLLNDLIAAYDRPEDIDVEALPDRFVIKASHGSGWNLICKDKSKVDWFWWKQIMASWLHQNLYIYGREWNYRYMKPRLIVEKYLEDATGELRDYKFYCFNGQPKFVQVEAGRFGKRNVRNFYSLDWELMPFGKESPPDPNFRMEKPSQLLEMEKIVEDLAKGYPFVRIDLYSIGTSVLFGEFTFFPASGNPNICPDAYDEIIGNWLTLPLVNNSGRYAAR